MMDELNSKVDLLDRDYIESELERLENEDKFDKKVSSKRLQKKEEEIQKLKKELEALKKSKNEKAEAEILKYKAELEALKKEKGEKNNEEIQKYKAECEKWKNEYYKAFADMANLRKDIEKDHSESVKYRLEGFIHDLISVLDSFDISLKYQPNSEETKNFLIGFQFVYTSLLNILRNEGVEVIEPKLDEKFNEKNMQAVDKVQSDGEENLVKEVMLKGYRLYDHLVRPAMVKVSAHEVETSEESNQKEETK